MADEIDHCGNRRGHEFFFVEALGCGIELGMGFSPAALRLTRTYWDLDIGPALGVDEK